MSKVTLNNSAMQQDGKHKITTSATFEDGTHYSGHIMITEFEIARMNGNQLKAEFCKRMIENLANELKELGEG